MVNSGAIATTSLAPGWDFLHEGLSRFAGRELPFDDEVYASATATNARNQEHRAAAGARALDRDPSRRSTSTPGSARSASARATSP